MSDRERSELTDTKARAGSIGIVLVTLAAGPFLMTWTAHERVDRDSRQRRSRVWGRRARL